MRGSSSEQMIANCVVFVLTTHVLSKHSLQVVAHCSVSVVAIMVSTVCHASSALTMSWTQDHALRLSNLHHSLSVMVTQKKDLFDVCDKCKAATIVKACKLGQ